MNVLTVGTNANLVFYGWRMSDTMEVSMCAPSVEGSKVVINSSEAGKGQVFVPKRIFRSMEEVGLSTKYDVVVLAASSLQDFQTKCSELVPVLHPDSIVIIESTGYINLEPFVALSFPKSKSLTVLSIMNEADVRQTGPREFAHIHRTPEPRIYLGSTSAATDANAVRDDPKFQRLCHVFGDGGSQLLTSFTPKEFMTYQWKLALPRVVFNPLMVIFEVSSPAELAEQILCKPLISGTINELFKIIKKMDCKLVKGFENEQNLLKSWSTAYPESKNPEHTQSPLLFYNFYHRRELELDLLLLQPILLADDHGIKSPYLENMYSTLCQYVKINQGESMLFERRSSRQQQRQLGSLQDQVARKQDELQQLEREYAQRQQAHAQLQRDIHEAQQHSDDLSRRIDDLSSQHRAKMTQPAQTPRGQPPADTNDSPLMLGDEFRGLAIHDEPNGHLEKEMELQRREQELISREQALAAQSPSQAQAGFTSPQARPNLFAEGNGFAGRPPQSFYGSSGSFNGRASSGPGSVGGAMAPGFGMPNGPPNGAPVARRVPSMPQIGQMGMNDMYSARVPPGSMEPNHSSFNNAAPIDPLLESRFKQNPKKGNRKSAYPQMSGNLDGFDVGGRGGMPMPGASKFRTSMGPNQFGGPPRAYGPMSVTNNPNVTNIMANRPPQQFSTPPPAPQQDGYLAPPSQTNGHANESQGSLASSASYTSPDETFHPAVDDSRPLGAGLGASGGDEGKKKKKKKGMFGRKK
ncbi:styryl dye vacuolar localization protein 3 [Diutina catenulata]